MTTAIASCRNCRTVLFPGAAACLRCGVPADGDHRDCPSCRRPSPADARFCAGCGSAMDTASPLVPVAVPEPFVRVRQVKRSVLVSAGAVLASVLVLWGGLAAVQSTVFSPEAVVEDYFAALAARDAAAALATLETAPEQETLPMTDDYQPPAGMVVTAVDETDVGSEGEWREVQVSYRLGDTPRQETLYLRRQDGKRFGLFDRWRIVGGVGGIAVPADTELSGLQVAGTTLTGGEAGIVAIAFPGTYQVGLADNLLMTADPAPVEVNLADAAAPGLTPRLKDTASEQVIKAVHEFVDTCAKRTELNPAGCPFGYYSWATATNVKWRIDTYPTLKVELNGSTVTVGFTDPGKATVSYTAYGEPQTATSGIYAGGSVTVEDGKVVLHLALD
ncbi:MAG TPA: zinc ribbon domain-containing protein [Actinoplanes sp.]|nr:zinc ribbon domain-containing protein [Actinoplanes sp.]